MSDILKFIGESYAEILILLGSFIGFLEIILSRFWPSKKRTSVLMKIAKMIHTLLDWLKVPDVKREEMNNKITMYGHVNEKHEE